MEIEQRHLFDEHYDDYRFHPQSKEDWDKIIEDGSNNKEAGAYGAIPAVGNTYQLGRWEYIGGPNGEKDPSQLLLVRLPHEEIAWAYKMAELREPPLEETFEMDHKEKKLKPLFQKRK